MSEPICFHCPKCGMIRDLPAEGEESRCLDCGHVLAPGDARDTLQGATEAEMAAILAAKAHVATMAETAIDIVAASIDAGEPMTQSDVIVAVDNLNLQAEHRLLETRRTGRFDPPRREPEAQPEPDPAPPAAAAATPPAGSASGWIVFAVGALAAVLAFPVCSALVKWNDLFGTFVTIILAIWAIRTIYKGLGEALRLGGRPIVTGVLTLAALNVCVGAGLALIAAMGPDSGGAATPDAAETGSNLSG